MGLAFSMEMWLVFRWLMTFVVFMVGRGGGGLRFGVAGVFAV